MIIYVCGPYSNASRAQRIANVHAAMDAGYALMKAGYTVFIPHLTHFVEEHAILTNQGKVEELDFWLRQDFAWLDHCDALLYLAPSRGADMELQRAKDQGKHIFYSLDDALNVEIASKSLSPSGSGTR